MSPLNPLLRLQHLETSSPRFPTEIATILEGEEYKSSVKTLQDRDSAWLADYLDNVLGTFDATSPVSQMCLRELKNVCGIHQTLPRSYSLPDIILGINGQPIVRGYYGDVHFGFLNGSKVRVKRLFTSDGPGQDSEKNFYEEAVVWKRLEHPNIVSLLGITIAPPPPQLISDWVMGSNLTEYINDCPGAYRLGLLSGIVSGLDYLHSNDVVHGDLKGPNILVDDSGRARITDFGLATIPQNQAAKRAFLDDQTTRWTAPEILHESGTYSEKADVFSLAMVMIEVFTGAAPFDSSPPSAATVAIMRGDRPPRPTHPACSYKLWSFMQRCWAPDPNIRPEVSEVFQVLPSSILDEIRSLSGSGMASHELQLALSRFYGGPNYQDRIDSLCGADLNELVNFLDNVLRTKGLNQSLIQQTLHTLRRVCGRQGVVPSSLVISSGLRKTNHKPPGVDRSPKVWVGKLNRAQGDSNRLDVNVKVVEFGETRKELYGDVATWGWLNHPNVLQCFGITANPLRVVSEWAANGDVMEYLQMRPKADRVCLLIDVVQGLDYLHSYGVTHRSLKSQSVLVNAAGRACISDIGFTYGELGAGGPESSAHGSPWIAPEIFKNGKYSKQSDVFSLGFVAAEMLTGVLFLERLSAAEVRSRIADGERPSMRRGKAESGATAEMWGMLTKCWEAEAGERIKVSDVLNFLQYTPQPISGTSYNLERAIARSLCDPGQDFIDELDEILERNEGFDKERAGFLSVLCKMCSLQRSVPKSMRFACHYSEQMIEAPHRGRTNAFRDEDCGRPVAIKIVRLHPTNDLEICPSRFCRETVAWKHLRHPNILPFLGVNLETYGYAMISEWMDNGNVNEYVQKHRGVNRVQLLVDAALGLDHLHNLQIVHGDLKGANILVTKDGRACVADFGFSTIIHAKQPATTNTGSTPGALTTSLMSLAAGGTFRWMSPELLYTTKFGVKDSRPTTQSDCYALGMVIYEVLLGKVPYWETVKESEVVEAIIKGERPKMPHTTDSLGFTDGLWRIVERSWMVDTDARPDVKAVLYHLSLAASTWNRRRPV